jgi:putative protease
MHTHQTELLAPARDLAGGLAAINCGADAVYMGAARFGARANAGNSLADIEALTNYAHKYWARVYVTLNTLLHDDELPEALTLIDRLHHIGIDGLIIQDAGLLECNLPPLPLIASTQMHNHTPERVAFLEQVGFSRVILARELDLAQIQAIRRQTSVELEFFVHGALCVSYSGQCYMSYAIGGRSGNRGECAQPCRRPYSLVDKTGRALAEKRYLLSLHDLNLSAHLADLLAAGITSFKIEGRLKDEAYVKNVVSFYRARLDDALAGGPFFKSSSGRSHVEFTPNVNKTFNRGYTPYFIRGGRASPGNPDTPKMQGEPVGRVAAVGPDWFQLDAPAPLVPGDGLTFFDDARTLTGASVNAVRGRAVYPNKMDHIQKGTQIYRNHDHAFLAAVNKSPAERRIAVQLTLTDTPTGFALHAEDEDGNSAAALLTAAKEKANQPAKALAAAQAQLAKTGDTEFVCAGVAIAWAEAWFLPLSALNGLRREVLAHLAQARAQNRPRLQNGVIKNSAPCPHPELTYRANVLNRQAAAFYRRHGVGRIEPAAESGLEMAGRRVMTTRYCLKHQLGWCPQQGRPPALAEPLFLVDDDGRRFRLRFNCAACEMEVYDG